MGKDPESKVTWALFAVISGDEGKAAPNSRGPLGSLACRSSPQVWLDPGLHLFSVLTFLTGHNRKRKKKSSPVARGLVLVPESAAQVL